MYVTSLSHPGILTLAEINMLRSEEFVWLFDSVIENNQSIATRVAHDRPFSSVQNLKYRFHHYLFMLNDHGKKDIIMRYPDFIGKLVEQESCSTATDTKPDPEYESMTSQQRDKLAKYNDSYKLKFRMPFIKHLEEGKKVETIFIAIQHRLRNVKERELIVAIQEICRICDQRIDTLVIPDVLPR